MRSVSRLSSLIRQRIWKRHARLPMNSDIRLSFVQLMRSAVSVQDSVTTMNSSRNCVPRRSHSRLRFSWRSRLRAGKRSSMKLYATNMTTVSLSAIWRTSTLSESIPERVSSWLLHRHCRIKTIISSVNFLSVSYAI